MKEKISLISTIIVSILLLASLYYGFFVKPKEITYTSYIPTTYKETKTSYITERKTLTKTETTTATLIKTTTKTVTQPKMEIYLNPLPKWNISYPSNWIIQKPNPNEVDFYSPEGIEIVIAWGQGYDKKGMRSLVESYLSGKGSLKTIQEKEIEVSGIPAILVEYTYNTMDKVYLVVARYFDYGEYGYSIVYDFISTDKQETLINICESIIATFKLGG